MHEMARMLVLLLVAVTLHSEKIIILAESSPYEYSYSTPNLRVQLNHHVNFIDTDNKVISKYFRVLLRTFWCN